MRHNGRSGNAMTDATTEREGTAIGARIRALCPVRLAKRRYGTTPSFRVTLTMEEEYMCRL